jgi:1,4-dihydroxy-2-naphthoyl-CoA hydrolase
MTSNHWLRLNRHVRFGDTDAAGVIHFHQLLRWCHEAYEESLVRFGIAATAIFPSPGATLEIGLPIVHCQADYLAPLVVGDPLEIQLEPRRLDPGCFEVSYRFQSGGTDPQGDHNGDPTRTKVVALGLTRHLAIRVANRRRCPLPDPINRWLEASCLSQGIQPL